MFRMWGKTVKNNHVQREITLSDDRQVNRTKKVFGTLERMCKEFDLEMPQWMNGNIADFGRVSRTRFQPESFIESVDFDYLEIQVVEED